MDTLSNVQDLMFSFLMKLKIKCALHRMKAAVLTVFCAGIGPGMTTAGGRVLNVTAVAPTIGEARDRAYEAVGRISWPGMHFRSDIAHQGVS